jgi:hypothetical protein
MKTGIFSFVTKFGGHKLHLVGVCASYSCDFLNNLPNILMQVVNIVYVREHFLV